MFLNLWLDYLVCYTKYLGFPCKWVLERKCHLMYIMSDMQQTVFTDICSSWKSFLFKGRKVIWSHPFENVLKSTLGKLRYITAFLKPCTLSELLFVPERFAEHFTKFCHSHFTHVYPSGYLSNCFLHFHTPTMTAAWAKLKRNEKVEKNKKKVEVMEHVCLSE